MDNDSTQFQDSRKPYLNKSQAFLFRFHSKNDK